MNPRPSCGRQAATAGWACATTAALLLIGSAGVVEVAVAESSLDVVSAQTREQLRQALEESFGARLPVTVRADLLAMTCPNGIPVRHRATRLVGAAPGPEAVGEVVAHLQRVCGQMETDLETADEMRREAVATEEALAELAAKRGGAGKSRAQLPASIVALTSVGATLVIVALIWAGILLLWGRGASAAFITWVTPSKSSGAGSSQAALQLPVERKGVGEIAEYVSHLDVPAVAPPTAPAIARLDVRPQTLVPTVGDAVVAPGEAVDRAGPDEPRSGEEATLPPEPSVESPEMPAEGIADTRPPSDVTAINADAPGEGSEAVADPSEVVEGRTGEPLADDPAALVAGDGADGPSEGEDQGEGRAVSEDVAPTVMLGTAAWVRRAISGLVATAGRSTATADSSLSSGPAVETAEDNANLGTAVDDEPRVDFAPDDPSGAGDLAASGDSLSGDEAIAAGEVDGSIADPPEVTTGDSPPGVEAEGSDAEADISRPSFDLDGFYSDEVPLTARKQGVDDRAVEEASLPREGRPSPAELPDADREVEDDHAALDAALLLEGNERRSGEDESPTMLLSPEEGLKALLDAKDLAPAPDSSSDALDAPTLLMEPGAELEALLDATVVDLGASARIARQRAEESEELNTATDSQPLVVEPEPEPRREPSVIVDPVKLAPESGVTLSPDRYIFCEVSPARQVDAAAQAAVAELRRRLFDGSLSVEVELEREDRGKIRVLSEWPERHPVTDENCLEFFVVRFPELCWRPIQGGRLRTAHAPHAFETDARYPWLIAILAGSAGKYHRELLVSLDIVLCDSVRGDSVSPLPLDDIDLDWVDGARASEE